MSKKITVYSTRTCPYCRMLKGWLLSQKLDYEDVYVDQDHAAAVKMVELSGQMGVPFTTIEENGQIHKILGFDLPSLKSALI